MFASVIWMRMTWVPSSLRLLSCVSCSTRVCSRAACRASLRPGLPRLPRTGVLTAPTSGAVRGGPRAGPPLASLDDLRVVAVKLPEVRDLRELGFAP